MDSQTRFGLTLFAAFGLVAAANPARAFTFTLTPVTVTTSNFAGTIQINGTVTVGPGETFISPNLMSSVWLPFLPSFSAGFNGPGQTWDAGFLAWNGIGTYTGAIYNHQIIPGNLGFSGGMPLGLYNFNPFGPGGQQPAIRLWYTDASGASQSNFATYAIDVIPAPGSLTMASLCGLLVARRRR